MTQMSACPPRSLSNAINPSPPVAPAGSAAAAKLKAAAIIIANSSLLLFVLAVFLISLPFLAV
jgi:hypothetical protein